jgi:hypothetical protein
MNDACLYEHHCKILLIFSNKSCTKYLLYLYIGIYNESLYYIKFSLQMMVFIHSFN